MEVNKQNMSIIAFVFGFMSFAMFPLTSLPMDIFVTIKLKTKVAVLGFYLGC